MPPSSCRSIPRRRPTPTWPPRHDASVANADAVPRRPRSAARPPQPAPRPERGGEARAVVAADGSQGLGDVPLEVDDGLLEAVVGVGEVEEDVEEAVVGGAGGERDLRLGEVEEVT